MPTIHLKSMRQCPHCFHLIPASAYHCPYCEVTGQPRPVIPTPQPWSGSSDTIATPTVMLPRDESQNFVGKSSKTLLWVMIAAAVVVIAVVLILLLKKDNAEPNSFYFNDEAIEETLEEAYSPAEEFLGTYSGYLDGIYDITLTLNHADDRTVSGSYYYGNGRNGSLDLEGYVSDDVLYLSESDSRGRQTATWECTKYDETIHGTMTTSDGKSFSVYLTQID